MSNSIHKETKEKIDNIMLYMKEKTPEKWHDGIKESVEKYAADDKFFLVRDIDQFKEELYKEALPYIIYDMDWELGDKLTAEDGTEYIIGYDDGIEHVNKRFGLFNLETATFERKNASIIQLKRKLENWKTFAAPCYRIVDIEKNNKEQEKAVQSC